MPEYLAPGVYVEEVSFRSKSIEGVSTSVTGFVGPTLYGPTEGEPELLTKFADFERIYGGIYPLKFDGDSEETTNYVAHAVRAFFDNGGSKLYVTRVYQENSKFDGRSFFKIDSQPADTAVSSPTVSSPTVSSPTVTSPTVSSPTVSSPTVSSPTVTSPTVSSPTVTSPTVSSPTVSSPTVSSPTVTSPTVSSPTVSSPTVSSPTVTSPTLFHGLRARFPGATGNMRVTFAVKLSSNTLVDVLDAALSGGIKKQFRSLQQHDVVYVLPTPTSPATSPSLRGLYDVGADNGGLYLSPDGTKKLRASDIELANATVHLVTVGVRVLRPGRFESEQSLNEFSPHPSSRNSLSNYFTEKPDSRQRALTVPFAILPPPTHANSGTGLMKWLLDNGSDPLKAVTTDKLTSPFAFEKVYALTNGSDGQQPKAEIYRGSDTGIHKTGLETFTDIDEISIVAAPGVTFNYTGDTRNSINQTVQHLLTHCERMRYRVAVLDAPNNKLVSEVREFRSQFDSKYAALYYPWIKMQDPLDETGRRDLLLPPSGFVAGIYARNDAKQPGVSKAPANEDVQGAIGCEFLLNKAQQDVLNPEGINCFRFFEGRGNRVWGARTISSDPEWKYINVRRYFAYIEKSIDKGTQWVVFENNNERLWSNVEQTVKDFLYNEWNSGGLSGPTAEDAYYVRCDGSTMTPNDLDNGRLVCEIGIRPQYPAEFVIFRIGQFTLSSRS